MNEINHAGPVQIGFLTIFQEGAGYLGGYLVTNSWGRPLEFRLSTAVQPNRVQSILYGSTLEEYLRADLIGKTLIDKTAASIHLLVTDAVASLSIRSRLDVPVLALVSEEDPILASLPTQNKDRYVTNRFAGALVFDSQPVGERSRIEAIFEKIDPSLDFGEPFGRIREAMTEARKMGAMNRAA